MPPVNLALLGTIVITAIVGGAIGYATHWLQTRHQRKWQKIDEAHKTAIRMVQGLQTGMLDVVTFISMKEHGYLPKNEAAKELTKLATKLHQLPVDMSTASILLDAELAELYQEIISTYKKFVDSLISAQSLSDEQETPWDFVHEAVAETYKIMTLIDKRFEQLKSRVW